MILEWLRQTIFARKLTEDVRTIEEHALIVLEVPNVIALWNNNATDLSDYDSETVVCAWIPPDFGFYYQLIAVLFLQTLFNALLGVFLFKFVIEHKENEIHKNTANKEKCNQRDIQFAKGDTVAWIFSFGIAMPCVILQPIYTIQALEIRNLALIMLLLATPIVNSLRITEALFGFTPHKVANSIQNYVLYFSCCFGLEFDAMTGNPKPATMKFWQKRMTTLVRDFAIVSTVICVLRPYNYEFFNIPDGSSVDSTDHTLLEMISWQHLGNNFLVALLISAQLSESSLGISLIYSLVYGIQTYEVVLNPMLKSRSPTDFWGRRWNMLVHKGLKNGVYKPTRKNTTSRLWAVVATFVVSGIIHEYVNFVMFRYGDMNVVSFIDDYRFTWKQMMFFGWNGILILLEYTIGHWKIFRWIEHHLPPIAVTSLVLCCALPLAHLFTGDWIKRGFFEAIYLANPIVVCRR